MKVEFSHKIENMGLISSIMVVVIHIGWPGQDGSVSWYLRELIQGGIARVAVPFFFSVSGFFLAKHFDEPGWWFCAAKKRVNSLVLPYVVWCSLLVISKWSISVLSDLLAHRPIGTSIVVGSDFPLRTFGLDFACFPENVPLWYIRSLVCFVIICPLIKFLLVNFQYVYLVGMYGLVAGIFYCQEALFEGVKEGALISYFTCGFSMYGLFCFSVGALIRLKGWYGTRRCLANYSLLLAILILLLKPFLSTEVRGLMVNLIFVPFALYGIWHYMPDKPFPSFLRGCAFPIFLIHMIVIIDLNILLKVVLDKIGQPYHGLVLFLSGVVISILVCNGLRRFFPRLSNIMFGGRI